MKNNHLTIGIPAYTIFRGGGLMHFLFQAIPALSQARPNWTFEIVGSIALPELVELATGNIHHRYWDNDSRTCIINQLGSQVLKWMGKGSDAGFLLQKQSELYSLPWGEATNRVAAFHGVDAVWVPFYNISLNRISLCKDMEYIQVPVLYSIHDIHPAFYPEDHPAKDLARFYQGFVPMAQSCQHIFTHSQYQKSAIVRFLQISDDKISVVAQPPLVDPSSLLKAFDTTQTSQTLDSFGIHRSYAFYPASTTHIHKNHTRLLAAWAQLKKLLGHTCPLLVFTGKGNQHQYENLVSRIAAFGLQNDVLFTGTVDTPTLATLFQNCIMVVIPTLFEGAGSGILTDALVTGKPIACADIPQVHEQLAMLGPVNITMFDPQSIPAITTALETILRDLNEQQHLALQNQALAQTGFVKMWQAWAEAHAQRIELMTAEYFKQF